MKTIRFHLSLALLGLMAITAGFYAGRAYAAQHYFSLSNGVALLFHPYNSSILNVNATPESSKLGNIGSLAMNKTGGADTSLYVKTSGTGTTGWKRVQTSDSSFSAEVTFTETSGAGTYTGSVTVPAGATITDIIVNGVALWNNAGAVTMIVGDAADDNGYYDAVNLKATDLLAGESLSFALAGGKAGAYIANSQVSPRYSATSRVVSGIITSASTGGSTGRTRLEVMWTLPVTATAATKV